jgi:hypothetical protein
MNFTDSARFIGYKLTKPQINLLAKLEAMGVEASDDDLVTVINPVSGNTGAVNGFLAPLIKWVYDTYATYNFAGTMNYHGEPVSIQTFDRVRMLILSLDSEVYSNFID